MGDEDEASGSSEDNVMSREEFEKIEKKEGRKKGGLFGRKQQKPEERKAAPDTATDAEKLSIEVDMLRGKMEMFDASRGRFEDKFTQMAEEIGELRSSLLEKEKMFGQVETGFRKIKDSMDEMEPQKFAAMLRKTGAGLEECSAKIEGNSFKIKKANEDIAKINTLLEKIKSFENLVDMGRNIEGVLSKVKDSESTSRRFASKVERIFGELDTKIIEFSKQKDRIDKMQNLVDEVVGSMDGIEARLKRAVMKDDFDRLGQEVNSNFDAFKSDINDKINDLKDIVDLMVSTIERRAKRVISLEGRLEKMESSKTDLKTPEIDDEALKDAVSESGGFSMQEEAKAPVQEVISGSPKTSQTGAGGSHRDIDRLYDMLDQAFEYVGKGDFTVARELYMKILEIYENMSSAVEYEENLKLYDSIKGLYEKLSDVYGSEMGAF